MELKPAVILSEHEPEPFESDPNPWPYPVDGPALLDDVRSVLNRFVALPDGADIALALWALHTHALDATHISPVLAIVSPAKRCGKTTLLDVLSGLVRRPLVAANVTQAVIYRAIEQYRPTLLIDEADTFLEGPQMRGILNSGFRANGSVLRNDVVNKAWQPKRFSTWSAKAIAMIGMLPDTLRDRSIEVRMSRRPANRVVHTFRPHAAAGELAILQQKACRWAADHLDALKIAEPIIPDGLNDRARDCWEPLLAISDELGGDWAHLAREACIALSAGREALDNETAEIQLLGDIKDYFDATGGDRASTENLLDHLYRLEDRIWGVVRYGRRFDARQLSEMLRPFGIRPTKVRTNRNETRQGYYRATFEEAWTSYLPRPEQQEHTSKHDIEAVPQFRNVGELMRNRGCVSDAQDD